VRLYSQHQRRRCFDYSQHLRNLRRRDQIGFAQRDACASTNSDTFLADANPTSVVGARNLLRAR